MTIASILAVAGTCALIGLSTGVGIAAGMCLIEALRSRF